MTAHGHWCNGPAKWSALIVLGSASIVGVGWSILNRRPLPVNQPIAIGSAYVAGKKAVAGDAGSPTTALSRKIDLNTAKAAAMELLPGVGPVLAGRIVADREANGPFSSVADLQRVKGIGPRTVERISPMATAIVPEG